MRFRQIGIGLSLAIIGVAGAAFSLPSYPVIIPDRIEAVHGDPAQLPIVLWNLRSAPITVTFLGDCCSLPKEVIVAPYSSAKLDLQINTDSLPTKDVRKIASFQYKVDGRTTIKAYAYTVRVQAR